MKRVFLLAVLLMTGIAAAFAADPEYKLVLENHKFDVAPTVVGVRYDNFAHALGEGGEFLVTEIEKEEA